MKTLSRSMQVELALPQTILCTNHKPRASKCCLKNMQDRGRKAVTLPSSPAKDMLQGKTALKQRFFIVLPTKLVVSLRTYRRVKKLARLISGPPNVQVTPTRLRSNLKTTCTGQWKNASNTYSDLWGICDLLLSTYAAVFFRHFAPLCVV